MYELDKLERTFVKNDLIITWENIEPYYQSLLNESIDSLNNLYGWLKKRSELEAILEEDFAWRYIKMTCDTTDENHQKDFEYFATEIEPKLSEYSNQLNEKFLSCEFIDQLDQSTYGIYIRSLKTQIEIFRQENIPLNVHLKNAKN